MLEHVLPRWPLGCFLILGLRYLGFCFVLLFLGFLLVCGVGGLFSLGCHWAFYVVLPVLVAFAVYVLDYLVVVLVFSLSAWDGDVYVGGFFAVAEVFGRGSCVGVIGRSVVGHLFFVISFGLFFSIGDKGSGGFPLCVGDLGVFLWWCSGAFGLVGGGLWWCGLWCYGFVVAAVGLCLGALLTFVVARLGGFAWCVGGVPFWLGRVVGA